MMRKSVLGLIFVVVIVLISVRFIGGIGLKANKQQSQIEYKDISELSGGYEIKFQFEGRNYERNLAYKYFISSGRKQNDLPDPKEEEIGIDLYDVDGDGRQEILAYIESEATCNRHGCDFFILKPKSSNVNQKEYEVLLSPVWLNKKIKIISSSGAEEKKTKIVFYSNVRNPSSVFEWNGKSFEHIKLDFNSLSGYKVFSKDVADTKKYNQAQELAYQYFQERYPDNSKYDYSFIKKEDIRIDLYDIDEDGENEIIAYLIPHNNITFYCSPEMECPFGIIKILTSLESVKSFKEVLLEGKSEAQDMTILDESTNGLKDILFWTYDVPGSIWSWDGKKYQFKTQLK